MWSGGQTRETLVDVCRLVNPQVLHSRLDGPHGVIFLSGHLGNWENLASSFALHLGVSISVIAQRQRNRRIDEMMNRVRSRWGCRMVSMGVSTREVFRALQEGKAVAMLGDQSGPKESIFLDFFGRPAATHRGAAAFSLKAGAPIIMVMFVRAKDGKYDVHFEEVDRNGIEEYTEENIVELTRRHTQVLEKYIRMYPDQWLWMHKRWKHTEYYEVHRPLAEVA
jgi:KDO2-lipid IV(A) lauroyltransferase